MRSRIRLFFLVGTLATVVDVSLVVALRPLGLVAADIIALTSAAVLAYVLNRTITFRGQSSARWVCQPSLFAATAVVAGMVDVAVLVVLDRVGLIVVVAKLVAVLTAAVIRWFAYRWILFSQVRRELAERVPRAPAPGSLRLSVVVPAYNEGELIAGTVNRVRAELEAHLGSTARGTTDPGVGRTPGMGYEVIVVDDGSSDDTASRAAAAGAVVHRLEKNRGKGAAVRAGVLHSRGRSVVFTDADLAYPARLVVDVMEKIEDGWDVVVGSRRHDDTNTLVRAGRLRELGGRVINLLTHIVLLGNFRDTQCGLKGFRGDIGRAVFERTRIDGFAFDVELFLIAEQDQLSLTEIPVSVANRTGSSVRIVGHTVELLVDLFRIRRWAGEGRYRPNLAQAEILSSRTPCDC